MSEPDIILTENAAKRVAWIAERQSRPAILRLAVDGGGCAGFTYKFELGSPEKDDTITETDGVKLVVDKYPYGQPGEVRVIYKIKPEHTTVMG